MFIRRITIQRYRGIERLEWQPVAGVNCLIGPADAGKTTVLGAISLLLAPVTAASEFDYYRRKTRDGFEIRGVLGGIEEKVLATMRLPPLRGWLNGELRTPSRRSGR